jgi:hypothetical protein
LFKDRKGDGSEKEISIVEYFLKVKKISLNENDELLEST